MLTGCPYVCLATYEQLQEYEQKLFGSIETSLAESFRFEFGRTDAAAAPTFNTGTGTSIFDRPLDVPQQFTFGAGQGVGQSNPSVGDIPMGGA